MSEVDTKETHAEVIRRLIEHDNTLQNYRFTWSSAAQALLLAALGSAWDKGSTLVYLICFVGVAVAVSAMAALRLSDRAYSASRSRCIVRLCSG